MIVFVDPSIDNPGFTLWKGSNLLDVAAPAIKKAPIKKDKYRNLCHAIEDFIAGNQIHSLFIEVPNFRTDAKSNMRGPALASVQRTVGVIEGWFLATGVDTYEISVKEWKGNDKKALTEYEARLNYPHIIPKLLSTIPEGRRNNAFDAIGLGHYVISNPEYHHITRKVRL